MILINSSPKDALKTFQPFLPIFVPVGLGCLLAVLEREGIKTKFIDEQVEDNIILRVSEYVKELSPPYIFGFSVLTAALNQALIISKELKKLYPDSIICFGGIHPTASPEEVLSHQHIDLVLRNEGEYALVELYRSIKDGEDFRHIKNLSYRSGDKIVHNESNPPIKDLCSLPAFPYHLFTSKRYDLGFVISSRGCPYNCIFCSNRVTTGKNYRVRATQAIIEELEMLYYIYNRTSILFLDDNLLVNKERINNLIEGIKEKGLHKKMIFNFQARGDNVNPEILRKLYDAGFRSVFFGMETSSERIMKIIKKGETVSQCVEAVKMAKEIGFHVSATFIYSLPTETHEDRIACAKMARGLNLDMVRFNNATPYPGTELFSIAKSEGRLNIVGNYENFNSVSTFIEHPFKRIPLSYVPEGNTEIDIRRDILYSYFYYYLNINKIKQIFAKPELGVGWFNAGGNFMEFLKKLPALCLLFAMFIIKFAQVFYYSVLKRETAISFMFFLKMFEGLWSGQEFDSPS